MRVLKSIIIAAAFSLVLLPSCQKASSPQKAIAPITGSAGQPDLFAKRIEKIGDRVYCAVGYALANSMMVVANGGKVIIDTTESVPAAREIKEQFDRIAPGPVTAIIYTHTHPDHILGASVFYQPGVPIWAHASAKQEMDEQFASLGATLRYRGAKQFGLLLDPALKISNGIGPQLRLESGPTPPLLYPTQTFTGRAEFAAGGVNFELHEAPGETTDQIFVWLPKEKVLFPGDNIYQAFPNLYSTRGVPPRPVRRWIASLDEMRTLAPDFLVPSHTGPIRGASLIQEILTAYRDGIEFVHDSVIRLANAGLNPDEMVEKIKLPSHLGDHPYLQETYGKVSWSVRGIYDGYLGWFDGNATNLERLPAREYSRRMVQLAGGQPKVGQEMKAALERRDWQWAAELADLVLTQEPQDAGAKNAKAQALRQLGQGETNFNARGYYLTSALELEGQYESPKRPKINIDTIRNLPVEVLLNTLPERLNPDRTADINKVIGFEFIDSGKHFTFLIRRGVGEINGQAAVKPDLKFTSSEADFKAFLIGDLSPASALVSGRVRVQGGLVELVKFKSYLIEQ